MNAAWKSALVPLAGIAGFGLVAWPLLGPAGGAVLAALLACALLFRDRLNRARFQAWLLDPRPGTIPQGTGEAWEQLFSRLGRLQRTQAHAEARLQEALTRFQRAGAAMPEAVAVLDQDNHLEWCNPRATDYFNLDPERDRGRQVTNVLRQPPFVEYLARGDFASPLVLRLPGHGAGEFVFSVQIVPYGDRQKLLLGRDITRAERQETMRRDFVANVSHELRTPLTVLSGFLEMLSAEPGPDPVMARRSITLMSEQAHRMNRLVDDLLTLSRLESSAAPASEELVDVAALLAQLQRDAQALSAGRHVVTVHCEPSGDLRGDPDELRSAFGNLVTNAVRYTPEGGRIDLLWQARHDGAGVFAVRDTGVGIDPRHLDRITERFYRVDRSRSRETGGTGLGLAIVKHVLSHHQAQLEIDSEPGRGSEFRLVFPAERLMPVSEPAAPVGATG